MDWEWFQLPKEGEHLSLWGCLHDGELLSASSNTRARTLRFEFQVDHLADEVIFSFEIVGVVTVMATRHPAPYAFEKPADATNDELNKLVKDYQKSWRTESMDWNEFESALITDPLQIGDADLFRDNERAVLLVGGFLDSERYDDLYCSISISASDIRVSRSDGKPCDLQTFRELGRDYWDSFSRKNTKL
jgi:hypothetical protein